MPASSDLSADIDARAAAAPRAKSSSTVDEVQQALDDDGRKGRGGVQSLLAREQVRPQDFADTAGQQEEAAKPMTVVRNAVRKRASPSGRAAPASASARST